MRHHIREKGSFLRTATPVAGRRGLLSPAGGRIGIAAALAVLGPFGMSSSLAAPAAPAAAVVSVKPNLPSSQPVGTAITWTVRSTGLKKPVYRFSISVPHGPTRIVRDFDRTSSFTWTPLQEGAYTIHVTAKDGFSATSTRETTATFTVTTLVKGNSAVVTHLANPLVALYSAPACAHGSVVVMFRPASGSSWQSTASHPCVANQSVNVIVAGMQPGTRYVLRHVVVDGTHRTVSASLPFTTGTPSSRLKFARYTVKQPASSGSDRTTPLIFHALNPSPSPTLANPIATDLSGHLVWYYDTLRSGLTMVWPLHLLQGGTFLMFGRDHTRTTGDNVLREVDLAGDTVRETNVDAVNAQLIRRGQHVIYAFHHDAIRLPNGNTAVLGETQEKVGRQDVMSDMILVLDANFQVVWTWDLLDHMKPGATFPPHQTCGITYPNTLCAVPNPKAQDWTHSNGLGWSPVEGDLTLSIRHLDTVLKIDYRGGRGSGAIVWRLGKGGDFTLKAPSSIPYPWFSHQHNAAYIDDSTLVLFDNSNVRCLSPHPEKGCHSRGQVIQLNEKDHSATLLLNADLDSFRQALGSAQALPNGNFLFAGGFPASAAIEVRPNGTRVYDLATTNPEYRDYRIGSLS